MRITIADRLHPFVHAPGLSFPLPGSTLIVQVFPTRIRIYDAKSSQLTLYAEIINDLKGPFEDFTAMLDLEKGHIRVWGHSATGYVRYRIEAAESNSKEVVLTIEKVPAEKIKWDCSGCCMVSHEKTSNPLILSEKNVHSIEQLSLGVNKGQDWELVHKRKDLTEIFPYWFRLGQLVEAAQLSSFEGAALLLNQCRQVIENGERVHILKEFLNLYLAGFYGVLAPQLEDSLYQGFDLPTINKGSEQTPFVLLCEGARLIRSLFVQQMGTSIHVLPALPPEFHCGRMLHVRCADFGKLDFEWTKKKMRRMIFSATSTVELQFCFPKEIRTFRLRCGEKGRNQKISAHSSINVLQGESYFLDNFEY